MTPARLPAEALVLPGIAGKTPGQIRAAIAQAVVAIDPQAARLRREKAQQDARVELWREDAGTAALCGYGLPPDQALAADQLISARARELRASGLDGTMDQLRVRAYLDFLLGKDSRLPPGEPTATRPTRRAQRHGEPARREARRRPRAPARPPDGPGPGHAGGTARTGSAPARRPVTAPAARGTRAVPGRRQARPRAAAGPQKLTPPAPAAPGPADQTPAARQRPARPRGST